MLQFTTRDALWLVTLVAMGAGWFADHVRQNIKYQREKAASVEAAVQLQIEWLRRYRGEAVGER